MDILNDKAKDEPEAHHNATHLLKHCHILVTSYRDLNAMAHSLQISSLFDVKDRWIAITGAGKPEPCTSTLVCEPPDSLTPLFRC